MEVTQPTQTQPTQKSTPSQKNEVHDDATHVCRLVCTTGQYLFYDLNQAAPISAGSTPGRKAWVFGRNKECDFVFSGARLSNKHFQLWLNLNDRTLWIQDTSTNGTFLNGKRLVKSSNYILNQGDEIAVGVGKPQDVIRFVVLFNDSWNPSNSTNHSVARDEGIYVDFIVKNDTIGHGAFATVKKAIERSTGDSYAVKIINRRRAIQAGGESAMLGVNRELQILRKLEHPNIVRLKSFYEDIENYYLVMELVPGGDLMDFVAANGAIGEDATQVITKQILDGIVYVHKLGILHRDLKPDNILIMLDDPIVVKITDFGLAKISDHNTFMKTFCGTLAYVAPEVITGKLDLTPDPGNNYSNMVDIWSLGCLVYVLLTSHLPFNGKTQAQMFQKIKSGEYHDAPLNSYKISCDARRFLLRCLQVEPSARLTAKQLLCDAWLADVDGTTQDPASQASQRPLSLSQSTSQQSRKINNGVHVNASISKLDHDIMTRPLDGDRARFRSPQSRFKVPKRVVPLPQSQPLQHLPAQNASQNSANVVEVQRSGTRVMFEPRPAKRMRTSDARAISKSGADPPLDSAQHPQEYPPEIPQNWPELARNGLTHLDTRISLVPFPLTISAEPIHIRHGVNPYCIGRHNINHTFIDDDRMSKVHCLIVSKRHPVGEASIYESPAHGLEDLWLLDFSTNNCSVNGVRVGKHRKVQVFEGDRIDFFVDQVSKQLLSYTVRVCDPTGLYHGGQTLPGETRLVNVVRFDTGDHKYASALLAGFSPLLGVIQRLAIQRPVNDPDSGSQRSVVGQSTKRAQLQSGTRPDISWP